MNLLRANNDDDTLVLSVMPSAVLLHALAIFLFLFSKCETCFFHNNYNLLPLLRVDIFKKKQLQTTNIS